MIRRALLWLALLPAASTVGCASLWQGWGERPPPAPDPRRYPTAGSVVVDAQSRWYLRYVHRSLRGGTTLVTHREAQALLTEAAVAAAQLKIGLSDDQELVYLHARTLQPDGTVVEVRPQDILVEGGRGPGSAGATTTRVLRFPAARVGSVIEFAFAIERPWLMFSHLESLSLSSPVLRYRVELIASPELSVSLRVHNAITRLDRGEGAEGGQLRFQLDNLDRTSDERWAPPAMTFEPWWAFRVDEAPGFLGNSSWTAATHRLVQALYRGRLFDNAPRPVPPRDCQSAACRMAWAVDTTRELAAATGESKDFSPRSVERVVSTGTADSNDKAVLLYHLLRSAGLEAQFAFVDARFGGLADPSFPMPAQLNKMIVRVPAQHGLARATWVAPACEYCAVGVLPAQLIGSSALVVPPPPSVLSDDREASFATVEGEPAPMGVARRHFEVRLEERGAAEVDLTYDTTGHETSAMFLSGSTRTAADWERFASRYAQGRAPGSTLLSQAPPTIDRRAGTGRWRVGFRAPAYATVDGARLVVPLTLLDSTYDRGLPEGPRKAPLFAAIDDRVEETVRLWLPPGFRLAARPADRSASSPRFVSELKVTEEAPDRVRVTRSIEQRRGQSPPSSITECARALGSFAGARTEALVLERAVDQSSVGASP